MINVGRTPYGITNGAVNLSSLQLSGQSITFGLIQ